MIIESIGNPIKYFLFFVLIYNSNKMNSNKKIIVSKSWGLVLKNVTPKTIVNIIVINVDIFIFSLNIFDNLYTKQDIVDIDNNENINNPIISNQSYIK